MALGFAAISCLISAEELASPGAETAPVKVACKQILRVLALAHLVDALQDDRALRRPGRSHDPQNVPAMGPASFVCEKNIVQVAGR
jgi:hypothetical protein